MVSSRLRSLPSARRTVKVPSSSTTAIPAESYPLYSSFLSPSSMTPTTCLSPTYLTIPHILFVTSLFFPITPIENLEPEVRGLNPGPANLSIRSGIRHRKLAVSTVTSSNTSNPKARCFYCHFIKYFEPESSLFLLSLHQILRTRKLGRPGNGRPYREPI